MEKLHFLGLSIFVACILGVVGVPLEDPIIAEQWCTKSGTYDTWYPGNCDKYVSCKDGKGTAMSCGFTKRFDENTMKCQTHWWLFGNVNCTMSSHTSSPTTKPPNPTASPTGATTKNPTGSTTAKGGVSGTEVNFILLSIMSVVLSLRFIK